MRDEPVRGPGRVRAALERMPWDEARRVLQEVLASPAVMRAAARIQEEELRAGAELRPRYQRFADQYRQAVASVDLAALSQVCHGKHSRWGRACVLEAGHEAQTDPLHWGLTTHEDPIAWLGSAPDDD